MKNFFEDDILFESTIDSIIIEDCGYIGESVLDNIKDFFKKVIDAVVKFFSDLKDEVKRKFAEMKVKAKLEQIARSAELKNKTISIKGDPREYREFEKAANQRIKESLAFAKQVVSARDMKELKSAKIQKGMMIVEDFGNGKIGNFFKNKGNEEKVRYIKIGDFQKSYKDMMDLDGKNIDDIYHNTKIALEEMERVLRESASKIYKEAGDDQTSVKDEHALIQEKQNIIKKIGTKVANGARKVAKFCWNHKIETIVAICTITSINHTIVDHRLQKNGYYDNKREIHSMATSRIEKNVDDFLTRKINKDQYNTVQQTIVNDYRKDLRNARKDALRFRKRK